MVLDQGQRNLRLRSASIRSGLPAPDRLNQSAGSEKEDLSALRSGTKADDARTRLALSTDSRRLDHRRGLRCRHYRRKGSLDSMRLQSDVNCWQPFAVIRRLGVWNVDVCFSLGRRYTPAVRHVSFGANGGRGTVIFSQYSCPEFTS